MTYEKLYVSQYTTSQPPKKQLYNPSNVVSVPPASLCILHFLFNILLICVVSSFK